MRKLFVCLLAVIFCITGCRGNQVEGSGADTTRAPALSDYEWKPIEPESPVTPDAAFTPNYAVMYENFRSVCRTDDLLCYKSMADAVLSRQASVDITQAQYDRVGDFFRFSPLFSLLESMTYTGDTLSLQYRYTEAEQKAQTDAFVSLCATLSAHVNRDSRAAAALSLYRAVAVECKMVFGEEESLLSCTQKGEFTPNALCELYTFMLLQTDIPALRVMGEGNVWTAFRLGEQWYHAIPSYESMDTQGYFLWYFGMTDAEVTAAMGAFSLPVPDFWQTYVPTPAQTEIADSESVPDSEGSPDVSDPESALPIDTAESESAPPVDSDPAEPDAEPDMAYAFVFSCADPLFAPLRQCDSYTLNGNAIVAIDRTTGEQITLTLPND